MGGSCFSREAQIFSPATSTNAFRRIVRRSKVRKHLFWVSSHLGMPEKPRRRDILEAPLMPPEGRCHWQNSVCQIKPLTSDCLIVLFHMTRKRMTEGWELQEASRQLQEFRHTCMVTPQIYGEPAFSKSDESTTALSDSSSQIQDVWCQTLRVFFSEYNPTPL